MMGERACEPHSLLSMRAIDDLCCNYPVYGSNRWGLKEDDAVFFCEAGIRVAFYFREHGTIEHVVAIHDGVKIAEEATFTLRIEEYRAEDVVRTIDIVAQVKGGIILMALKYRVIDVGSRYGDPADDVRIHRCLVFPIDDRKA